MARHGPISIALSATILLGAGELPAQGITIDHTCTDISKVPQASVDRAKRQLRVGYGHTSHGSQLVSGIQAFRGQKGSRFSYTSSDWGLVRSVFLNDYWGNAGGADDLGQSGDLGWRDATLKMLKMANNDRNVVMWSWCGGVSDNTKSGIDAYLNAMAQLERAYPDVKFVYMTGHLDGSGAAGNLNVRNEQIRAFCRTNNKILFDFADIESYDPDGRTNYMKLYATDACEYDSDGDNDPWGDKSWAEEWLRENPSSELAKLASRCHECAHSQPLNCILKGRAFWWMMARIAGWSGTSTSITITKPNGGEKWPGGTVRNIAWTCSGMQGNVKLVLLRNQVKLGNIAQNLPAGQKSYAWTVGTYDGGPAAPGSGYAVRIMTMDGVRSDLSDGTFSIEAAAGENGIIQ